MTFGIQWHKVTSKQSLAELLLMTCCDFRYKHAYQVDDTFSSLGILFLITQYSHHLLLSSPNTMID